MKLRAILPLAVTLLLGSGAARADFLKNLTSPGPLAKGHDKLDGQCDKCHVPFKGIPNSACLACHTGTERRIKQGLGPHAVADKEGRKCSSCHTDHKGRNHPLSPKVDSTFVHAITGFLLDGKHAQAKCESCHKPNKTGTPAWVDLPRTCKGCHEDTHRGALGSKCESCHTAQTWKPATRTIAQHQIDMTGKHAGLTCQQCHSDGKHLTAKSSCGDCHEQNHGPTKAPCATCHNTKDWKSATFKHDFCTCILPGKHQTAPCLSCHPNFKWTPTPFACSSCHTKERKHEELGPCSQCHSALSWKTKAFDHNRPQVGFKIEGEHTEAACENCHKQKGVFRGAPKTCEGCHKTPLHGDFGACAKCHNTSGWMKTSFSHSKTAFPLDNKHDQVTCQTCHRELPRGAFKSGPNQCATCHKDPHKGQFLSPPSSPTPAPTPPKSGSLSPGLDAVFGVKLAGPLSALPKAHTSKPLGCLDCHTTKGWSPSTIDSKRHADTLGFPLLGKHEGTRCASCHTDGQFVGTPRDCNQCHLDRHRGKLGNRACAECHDEQGWKPKGPFAHEALTGFALEGSHAKVACAECHGQRHEKLAQSTTTPTCATCHQPKHGKQFGETCTQCHTPTEWKKVPSFDHRQTMFPLDRRHQAVACQSCHDPKRVPRLDGNCATCHGNPHRGRTQLECSDCHRADRFTLVRFDHDRTIFPLRGRHFTTPCRDCHTNDQFTGIRSECVSCHRADRARADAEHLDHRGFSFDCASCHKPFKW